MSNGGVAESVPPPTTTSQLTELERGSTLDIDYNATDALNGISGLVLSILPPPPKDESEPAPRRTRGGSDEREGKEQQKQNRGIHTSGLGEAEPRGGGLNWDREVEEGGEDNAEVGVDEDGDVEDLDEWGTV